LAVLEDDDIARAIGIDADTAREAADRLDGAALAAIGIETGDFRPTGHAVLGRRVPLTAGAKAVLQQTLARAAAEKARTITTRHIMLALLDRHRPDPAASVLAELPLDLDAARSRMARAA
jgi:hypothetical protein